VESVGGGDGAGFHDAVGVQIYSVAGIEVEAAFLPGGVGEDADGGSGGRTDHFAAVFSDTEGRVVAGVDADDLAGGGIEDGVKERAEHTALGSAGLGDVEFVDEFERFGA